MGDDAKRQLEGLIKLKLQTDGEEKARTYVEMPDIPLPEEEVESGESKAKIQERMKKLAAMGAIGMGTSAVGAGLRDVGVALSTAKGQMGDGRIDVRSIAKKADSRLTQRVPRETARYLRAFSDDASPGSPVSRKSPIVGESLGRAGNGRSGSVSSFSSQSSFVSASGFSATAKAAAAAIDTGKKDAPLSPSISARPQQKSPSTESTEDKFSLTPKSPTSPAKSPLSAPLKPTSVTVGASLAKQKSEQGTSSSSSPSSASKITGASPLLKQKSEEVAKPKPFGGPSSPTHAAIKPINSPFLKSSSSAPSIKAPKGPTSPSKYSSMVSSSTKLASVASAKTEGTEILDTDPNRKFTLEELQSGTPAGVNPNKKEDSLKLSAFKKAFGVDPDIFAKYPEWKKLELRKQAKIF